MRILKILFRTTIFLLCLEVFLRMGGLTTSLVQNFENQLKLHHHNQHAIRIMCLGDSFTVNGGKDAYPEQLQRILNENNSGRVFEVINKGSAISTSATILAQFEEDIAAYKPDIVIVMTGLNDTMVGLEKASAIRTGKMRIYGALSILGERIKEAMASTRTKWMANKPAVPKLVQVSPQGELSLQQHFEQALSCQKASDFPAMEQHARAALSLVPPEAMYMKLPLYNLLAGALFKQGQYLQAENIYMHLVAASANDPNNQFDIWGGLVELFLAKDDLESAKNALMKQIQIDPQRVGAYEKLVHYYRVRRQYEPLEQFLKVAVSAMPWGNHRGILETALADCMLENKKYAQAQEVFERIRGQQAVTNTGVLEHAKRGIKLCTHGGIVPVGQEEYYGVDTVDNYRKLKTMARAHGLTCIFVQYPMLPIALLKDAFPPENGIYFVDNGPSFRTAVEKENYDAYFEDHYGVDFGHCTPKGNRLLAGNVAIVIWQALGHVI